MQNLRPNFGKRSGSGDSFAEVQIPLGIALRQFCLQCVSFLVFWLSVAWHISYLVASCACWLIFWMSGYHASDASLKAATFRMGQKFVNFYDVFYHDFGIPKALEIELLHFVRLFLGAGFFVPLSPPLSCQPFSTRTCVDLKQVIRYLSHRKRFGWSLFRC